MRIAITGARGQLGRSLQNVLAKEEVLPLNRPEFEITDSRVVAKIASLAPDLVIHTAAMTDVDGCESAPDMAYRVNALGTQNVALACQQAGAAMVYFSTDYVFDGEKGSPYLEFDEPNPINIYGRSKLVGERYVEAILNRFYIIRTAWLYSRQGRNFVRKVLELSEEREELHMVTTEVSSPTYAPDLAEAIARLIAQPHYGIYHLINEGYCSRYEFAKAILTYAGKGDYPLHPAREFPRPAKPPAFSALRNFCAANALGITMRPWEEALKEFFEAEG